MRNSSRILLVLFALTILARGAPKIPSIRSIDFKNFSFPWDDNMKHPPSYDASPWHWLMPLPQSRIRVVNGAHHFYEPDQSQLERERSPLVSVDALAYGDLDRDGIEEAAVHLNYSSGGTQNWDYLYVYKPANEHPRLMGILKSGERGYGGLYRAAIQNGLLILDFADLDRRVGDCCSEGYIRVRYRWRSGAFIEEGPRERGDVNLNEH
jgi:hypothetical protein